MEKVELEEGERMFINNEKKTARCRKKNNKEECKPELKQSLLTPVEEEYIQRGH